MFKLKVKRIFEIVFYTLYKFGWLLFPLFAIALFCYLAFTAVNKMERLNNKCNATCYPHVVLQCREDNTVICATHELEHPEQKFIK